MIKIMLRDETAAMGLPVRMVVLTVIGMAGLAAMIMFIGDVNLIPRSMHADIIDISGSTVSNFIHAGSGRKYITVEVVDVDGAAVEGATVIFYGLRTSSYGSTGADGRALIALDTSKIRVQGEGYLKLMVKAPGFADYQNDFALKVVSD